MFYFFKSIVYLYYEKNNFIGWVEFFKLNF